MGWIMEAQAASDAEMERAATALQRLKDDGLHVTESRRTQCLCSLAVALHSSMGTYHRHLISSGSTFEAQIAYSRAVVAGDWIMVSGTTGFDYSTMTIADDLEAQTEQCLRNINAALEQAGSSLGDIVRVHYILPEASNFPACWPVLRKYLGDIRPAATMFEARLADPRMKIEIEVTALRSSAAAVR